MSSIQAYIDAFSAGMRSIRSATQMTLGEMIKRLEELPPDTQIPLGECRSYRGYYSDLAFENGRSSAIDLAHFAKNALGNTFTGYKGGDFLMQEDTPVWVAEYGISGLKILEIMDDGGLVTAKDDI